jgi:hypothetical protein
VAKFDTPFLDLSYDGSIFIEDVGDACRYKLPNLKITRNSWPAPVTRDVTLSELIVSVVEGEPPNTIVLLKRSFPISISFPVVGAQQQLAPIEFTISKQLLMRTTYIKLGTEGILTIQGLKKLGTIGPDSQTTRAAWPLTVSSNQIISEPRGPGSDIVQISYAKPSDPNDMCSSRKIR